MCGVSRDVAQWIPISISCNIKLSQSAILQNDIKTLPPVPAPSIHTLSSHKTYKTTTISLFFLVQQSPSLISWSFSFFFKNVLIKLLTGRSHSDAEYEGGSQNCNEWARFLRLQTAFLWIAKYIMPRCSHLWNWHLIRPCYRVFSLC